ncbi:MAG TPA: Tad domain-containing protein, partial [Candidatus Dormibacteraeota bacterium]|nr:Tad domain-containing protein [Candidatus Dormibacteraeota bacterium]
MTARRRRQGGQALVVLALVGLALFGFGAIALDQGVGMSDRRDLQAIADSASLAGARSLPTSAATANWVALQYAARNLSLSPSAATPACSATTCAAGGHTIGNYTFTLTDNSGSLDLSISHTRRTLVAGVLGITTAVTASGARASKPGPATQAVNYAIVGVGGDVQVNGGGTGNPSGDVTGAVYAQGNFGANNGPHAVALPATVSGYTGSACSPSTANHVDVGGSSDTGNYTLGGVAGANLNTGVSAPTALTGFAPTTTGPTYSLNSASAWDASGNWNPGTYSGWYPSGTSVNNVGLVHTKMNPGVYVIQNVTSGIALSNLANAT